MKIVIVTNILVSSVYAEQITKNPFDFQLPISSDFFPMSFIFFTNAGDGIIQDPFAIKSIPSPIRDTSESKSLITVLQHGLQIIVVV